MPERFHHTTWCAQKAIDFMNDRATYGKPSLFSVNIFDPHPVFLYDIPACARVAMFWRMDLRIFLLTRKISDEQLYREARTCPVRSYDSRVGSEHPQRFDPDVVVVGYKSSCFSRDKAEIRHRDLDVIPAAQ